MSGRDKGHHEVPVVSEEDAIPSRPILRVVGVVVVVSILGVFVSQCLQTASERADRPSGRFPERDLHVPEVVNGVEQTLINDRQPAGDLRAHQLHELDSYGWSDAGRRRLHIPIDRAMELYVQREGEKVTARGLLPAGLAVAAALGGSASARAQTVAPPAVQKADVEERLGAPVPLNLWFHDEAGHPIRFAELFDGSTSGVPVVLVLAYYRCPALCGMVQRGAMSALAQVDLELGKDYRAVTVSFDPKDTPATAGAAKKSALHDVDRPDWAERWPFLLGDAAPVAALADAVGFRYGYDSDTDQFAHPSVLFVLTPDGRVSRYLYGVQFRPRDLKLALLEAGEGRIGSFYERVLLTCYRYDPATRRYGFYILGFMRIGALFILVVVGGFLTVMWRRDRRRYRDAEDPIAAARVVAAGAAGGATDRPPHDAAPRSPA